MRIESGFDTASLGPLLLAAILAWALWTWAVPRSLRGLQVAFERSPGEYEVHKITNSTEEARNLLSAKGMRFGVLAYVMALTGALLFACEWVFTYFGFKPSYSEINLSLGLVLVTFPAIISAIVSLGVQVVASAGEKRATLQDTKWSQNGLHLVIGILWFSIVILIYRILGMTEMDLSERRAISLFLAFAPAVIAYGRVLGSSWLPLMRNNQALSRGKPSKLHPSQPSTKRQFASLVVYITAIMMPFTALNALISVITMMVYPDAFIHSEKVLALPEYTLQSSVMEEGGLLGFYAIELFADIPDASVRVPLVTGILLFLLLNVAIVGIIFVFEVARILFLGLSHITSKGGIKLADSRLLRADPRQQAKVLNFTFAGFAGQSMLLFVLAMVTFWDSSFLPQGSECGNWENNVCSVLEKDMLEQLTWMLAAGGQIAFFLVWLPSWKRRGLLDAIKLEGGMGRQRAVVASYEDTIFLKQKSFTAMLTDGEWNEALSRQIKLEKSSQGIEFVRQTHASMVLHASAGAWESAEENALSILALKGGEDAPKARLILVAASLAERDFAEAKPRLERLPANTQESISMSWLSSILAPELAAIKDPNMMATASLLRSVRLNKELLGRWLELEPWSKNPHRDDPLGRRFLLGDVARMRLANQSDEALNRLEYWMKKNKAEEWVMGKVARALLYLDAGMPMTGAKISKELSHSHSLDPAVRELNTILNITRHRESPPSAEVTGFDWDTPVPGQEATASRWMSRWTVQPLPFECGDPRRKHKVWSANGWALLPLAKESGIHPAGMSFNQWSRKVGIPPTLPMGNHLLLSGLLTTIGGMPVDLGWPSGLDPNDKVVSELLDL